MRGRNPFLMLRGNDKNKCQYDLLEEVTEAGDDFRILGTIAVMQKYVSGRKTRTQLFALTMKMAPRPQHHLLAFFFHISQKNFASGSSYNFFRQTWV